MKANYEMTFYGENMNPSNPFPWVKLILIHKPLCTHSMNYTCGLYPKAMMWIFYWCKLIQLYQIHSWIKCIQSLFCPGNFIWIPSTKMHTMSFLDSNWWMDEPSFISHVMEFDYILRWNKFFEEISSMYSYISSTQHNSLLVSFPWLNFILVQWLNIHEISCFLMMKWDENSRWSQDLRKHCL
jgi:hypothetical protein